MQEDESVEDKINRIIESRKLLPNAGRFAFTATPKNKTLEIFDIAYPVGDEVKHRPFHGYTMKQAIQEGFILDVLKSFTPVASYYRLAKTVNESHARQEKFPGPEAAIDNGSRLTDND